MYRNIHIAIDGSQPALGAARFALELARGFDARLTALHVTTPPRLNQRLARLRAHLPEDRRASLSTESTFSQPRVRTGWLADDAADSGVSFSSEQLEGVAHAALITHMEPRPEDLLVMGSHGQSGQGTTSAGRVTTRFLR